MAARWITCVGWCRWNSALVAAMSLKMNNSAIKGINFDYDCNPMLALYPGPSQLSMLHAESWPGPGDEAILHCMGC